MLTLTYVMDMHGAQLIAKEGGISSLSPEEKEEAYRERRIGMTSALLSPSENRDTSWAAEMKEKHLEEWLALSMTMSDDKEAGALPESSLLLLGLKY
jgi:hypothetical protein